MEARARIGKEVVTRSSRDVEEHYYLVRTHKKKKTLIIPLIIINSVGHTHRDNAKFFGIPTIK